MRLSKSIKALFILLNHLVAAHSPPPEVVHQLHQQSRPVRPSTGTVELVGSSSDQDFTERSVPLFPRQEPQSCPICIERCPPLRIRSPSDCNRCFNCPPGMKGDANSENCIPRDNRKPTPEEKKKAMEDATEFKREELRQQKESEKPSRDQKRDAYEDKKERMKPKYQYRAKSDAFDRKKTLEKNRYDRYHDQRERSRARRAGRCLQIVPMAMGVEEANRFADEFFDEGYLNETMALVDLVPEYIDIPVISSEEEDEHWESDEYMQQWIDFSKNRKRSVYIYKGPGRGVDLREEPINGAQNYKDITIRSRDLDEPMVHKRFFWVFILPAIIRVGAQVAITAARIGLQASRYVFRFARNGASKVSRSKMNQEAKKISRDRNWDRCLKGDGPRR